MDGYDEQDAELTRRAEADMAEIIADESGYRALMIECSLTAKAEIAALGRIL